jgi:exonuclease-1
MLMLEGREEEAREMLMRCMSVSGRVKQEVISALGADDVSCLVAPFEADAQLTHMSRGGEVDYVISEDSDLLVYGCERVITFFDVLKLCFTLLTTTFKQIMMLRGEHNGN